MIAAAERESFAVLLTADRNLRYQQNLVGRTIAIVVLETNRWATIERFLPLIDQTLRMAEPGSFRSLHSGRESQGLRRAHRAEGVRTDLSPPQRFRSAAADRVGNEILRAIMDGTMLNHRMRFALAIVVPLSAALAAGPALAQVAAPPPPSITVEGSASAMIIPDTATLSFGVVTTRPKATEAVAENSRALADALAAIKAQGVAAGEITTTALVLTPITDDPKTGAPRVVGYQASNQVDVRLKTSDNLGKLAATLIDKGVNTVDDLRFSSSEEAATRERLKAEAARNARSQADIYVSALGLKLGRVLGIRPDGAPALPALARSAMVSHAASAPVPVEPGQLQTTERVSVTFELVQ